jgi:hypothetical protein
MVAGTSDHFISPEPRCKKAKSATTRTDAMTNSAVAHIYRPFNAIGHGVFGSTL